MDKVLVGLIVGIAVVLKLVCTGIFLVIGFRIGGKIYEHLEPKVLNKFNKVSTVPVSEPVTAGA
jgi:hypothetical protein